MALWRLPGGEGKKRASPELGSGGRFAMVRSMWRSRWQAWNLPALRPGQLQCPRLASNAAMASMAAGDTGATRAWPFTWARSAQPGDPPQGVVLGQGPGLRPG